MKAAFVAACLLAASGTAAFARDQYATPLPAGAQATLVVEPGPPNPKYAGPGMALVPGTSFLIFQAKGGNIFLGAILGQMRVKAKSKDLANKSVAGYLEVDLPAIAATSLAAAGASAEAKDGAYTIKPFGFIQQCDEDEMYRVSIAYDVKGPGGKSAWHGRYVAHLTNPIPYAHFHAPTDALIAEFAADLTRAADMATQLLQRDMRGEVPVTGRDVKVGSLNFICNKMGAMGMYTSAKEFQLGKTRVLEERDGNIVLSMGYNPNMMLYGLHTMARSQVHKLD